jgi:hypothetical protein
MTFKAEAKASVGWNWDDGAVDNRRLDYAKQLLEGNGPDQAEAVWHAEDLTLFDGDSITLDLTALTRVVLGDLNTLTLLTVKVLLVVNHGTSEGELLVGGADTDAWAEPFGADDDQIAVPPDSALLIGNRRDGWPVDDARKHLRLSAVGGDVDYSLAVVGTTSAAGSGSSGSGA